MVKCNEKQANYPELIPVDRKRAEKDLRKAREGNTSLNVFRAKSLAWKSEVCGMSGLFTESSIITWEKTVSVQKVTSIVHYHTLYSICACFLRSLTLKIGHFGLA